MEGRDLMKHALTTASLAGMTLLPVPAYAADAAGAFGPEDVLGAALLAGAVILLVMAVLLQRIADGSAMADNISYVVASAVCIGGAALAGWSDRFVTEGLTRMQIALAAEGLLLVAIVLLCVYFFRVRLALVRFQRVMTSVEPLAEMHAPDSGRRGAGTTRGDREQVRSEADDA